MFHVIIVYLFEGLEYIIHFYVGNKVVRFKVFIPDYGEKERGAINK